MKTSKAGKRILFHRAKRLLESLNKESQRREQFHLCACGRGGNASRSHLGINKEASETLIFSRNQGWIMRLDRS